MFARPMTIRTKLAGAFTFTALLLLLVAGAGFQGLRTLDRHFTEVTTSWLPSVRWSSAMNTAFGEYRTVTLQHILTTDQVQMQDIERRLTEQMAELDNAKKQYELVITSPAERSLYEEFSRNIAGYLREVEVVLGHSRKNENERAREHNNTKALPLARATAATLDKIVEFNVQGSEAERKAGDEAIRFVTQLMAVASGLGLLLLATLAALIIRAIGGGIASVTKPMGELAAGNLAVEIPSRGEKTEIGAIADAVQVFKDALIERRRLEEAAKVKEAGDAAEKRRLMAELARSFEEKVGGLVQHLSTAANQMEATARTMSSTAQQTDQQSGLVAHSALEAASNVQAVATATEELAASASEIGAQVTQTTAAASRAVDDARRTNQTVQTLAAGAQRIGDVVKLISDIAGQTNLLALNATIEAARAGEAGRGFAVVASEVKELASQTARATDEIAAQIGQIQTATGDVVEAIRGIGAAIENMHGIAASVAAAVEQQQAATQEIARNVAQAAQGTEGVTQNIGQVQQAATQTGSAATQVLGAAGELSRNAASLSREVSSFLAGIRAA